MSHQQSRILTCPHCGFECQYGVSVCRGCQSEIIYKPTCGESAGYAILGSIIGFIVPMVFVSIPFGFLIDSSVGNSIIEKVPLLAAGGFLVVLTCPTIMLFVGAIVGVMKAQRKWNYPRFIRGYKYS